MDVRGPADSHDKNNISHVRQQNLHFDSAEPLPGSSALPFTTHSQAREIVGLTEQLKALPEVREELVSQALLKLREGHFSTKESAERTAEAILGTLLDE